MDQILGEILLTLLHGVTNTHIKHLQSQKYSEHVALGEFYSGLEDKVDSLIEAIQGKYKTIIQYPVDYIAPAETGLQEVEELSQYFQENRQNLPQDTEIQNLCDEIQQLMDSTIYKLQFLQ